MVQFLLGIGGLILAGILGAIGAVQLGRLSAFEKAKTYTIQALRGLHDQAGGRLAQSCEVKGEVACDEPLIAPLSQKPCVAYVHAILREREEEYEVHYQGMYSSSTGVGSGKIKRVRQVSDRLPDEGQRVPFWLHDATGRLLVDPEGASLDLERAAERFEESEGWRLGTSRNRTLGHQRTEYILPVGSPCYVLGCATDRQGRLVVARHPHDRKQQFFISYRSEEQLTMRTGLLALVSLAAAIIFGLVGITLIALAFMA